MSFLTVDILQDTEKGKQIIMDIIASHHAENLFIYLFIKNMFPVLIVRLVT